MRSRRWSEGEVCAVCPALTCEAGAFDVIDRPGPESQFDPSRDCRVNIATGAPTCVHPYRVGLPVGLYASEGAALPESGRPAPVPSQAALVMPVLETDLEAWLVAVIATAPERATAQAIRQAEAAAREHFPSAVVVDALRVVLSHHLAG
ncbi:hypothetical protein [Glycomyces buryatensis]|uniref:Uncharacterized protein n=1 Tax=Glycomyces buryatensis TaxID=2570927 RepID=A0A4S8QJ37_9ACTN|nr:hypothetical protein [Glycomyces buryatensis]THV41379.1 hypothetical protein FAB82_11970 [Glycomyces buryatensis]